MKIVFTFFFLLMALGCSTVSPWEKKHLAKKGMLLNSNPIESRLHSHIYFSKEATSPVEAVAGGGCGCN